MRTYQGIFGVLLLIINALLHGEGRQFLCGSDEDGCYDFRGCACIPVDELEYYNPYCLDFDELICKPLLLSPWCEAPLIFKNQGECLAAIFQSEPHPACTIVSYSFCVENNIKLCESRAGVESCK